MAVENILASLRKGVYESFPTPQLHFHRIIKPLLQAGLSEIALYRAIAAHIKEKGLDPELMIDDVVKLFTELTRNTTYVRTQPELKWLAQQMTAMGISRYDEEHFFCNTCHHVKPNVERNSGNAQFCKGCRRKQNEAGASKSEKPVSQKPVASQDAKPTSFPIPEFKSYETERQFLNLYDLMTEPEKGEVTLLITCHLHELKEALEVLDKHLVKGD